MWQTRLSPDERWVCFNAIRKANETHGSTVYVVSTSGGEWVRITEGKYWDDTPRWAPDGKTLYFASNRTGFFNVWGIRFNSLKGEPEGNPFRVTDFEGPNQMPAFYGFTVGAKGLLVNLKEMSGNIWVLDNVDQ
jgi:sugar lactone lactonase YvrE